MFVACHRGVLTVLNQWFYVALAGPFLRDEDEVSLNGCVVRARFRHVRGRVT